MLVVEDDRSVLRSVRACLEASGWTAREAQTLRQGITEARSNKLDLAVVDLDLPDGDGVDFMLSLRERSSVPIIVLSARSEGCTRCVRLTQGPMAASKSRSASPNSWPA
ncbi:MAG TPA: response regulator [Caldimonas sp.]|nr:response regulator [Caldimonas sp.]HEV7575496.1 response regulator [Caldimonas sp.]